jgi:hypothetical protein
MCGNGTVATPHPSELFGEDWLQWGLDSKAAGAAGDATKDPDSRR